MLNGGVGGEVYPQMPVLLIPIVTSPSLRPSPFCTLSSDGSDSEIHSLCSGSVKTPTLGLLSGVLWVSVTVAMLARFWARRTLLVEGRAIGGIEGDMLFFSSAAEGDVFFVEG